MRRQDFYERTSQTSRNLTPNERQLYDFVIKNMHDVSFMTIREFASAHFVSATTIHRFAKKLGFPGFSDMSSCLKITVHSQQYAAMPGTKMGCEYREEYLKNSIEAVRVMSAEQVKIITTLLQKKPSVYILTDHNTHAIGQYCERLFIGLGFHAYFPEAEYQRQNLVNRIHSQDMILALSYTGQDNELLDFIQKVFLHERPHLLSITRADNNPLENLSDTNFYVFADHIQVQRMDLTSSVAMLMIVELLIYEYMSPNH